ncbi:MAG: mechanosensitive ion channel family protein, partial [Mucilaginibacter sp.]
MKFEEFYNQFHSWLISNGQYYIFGLIVFFIGLWFIRMLRARLRLRMSKRKVNSALQPFFMSLTVTGLYVLLLLTVLRIVGFELTVFSTIIGAFSV